MLAQSEENDLLADVEPFVREDAVLQCRRRNEILETSRYPDDVTGKSERIRDLYRGTCFASGVRSKCEMYPEGGDPLRGAVLVPQE